MKRPVQLGRHFRVGLARLRVYCVFGKHFLLSSLLCCVCRIGMKSCKHNCAVELVPSVHPPSTNICLADTDVSAHARALLKRAASPGWRDPPSNRPWTPLMPQCQSSRLRVSYFRMLTVNLRPSQSGRAHRFPLHQFDTLVAAMVLHQYARTWSRSIRSGASACSSTRRTLQLVTSDTQWH